jgi:PadR family transcriptional regulator
MSNELIRGHLDMLVLAIVQRGATHGYAITEQLRLRSDGSFRVPEGTLYPALYRLEDAGLLRSSWTAVDGRRRRVYQLTRAGKAALARTTREWSSFTAAVSSVLGSSPREKPA